MEPDITQDFQIIPASQFPCRTVIFLHGLGQTTQPWFQSLRHSIHRLPNVEWILPQSQMRSIAMSNGAIRPGWFNIRELPPCRNDFDENGIVASMSIIESIIQAKIHQGADSRNIILMGFSQGASLALMVALTTLHDLGGVASLSGWIPQLIREQMIHTEPRLPIFWGHGEADLEIPIEVAEQAVDFLIHRLSIPHQLICFRQYPGLEHQVSDEEMDDIARWLRRLPLHA